MISIVKIIKKIFWLILYNPGTIYITDESTPHSTTIRFSATAQKTSCSRMGREESVNPSQRVHRVRHNVLHRSLDYNRKDQMHSPIITMLVMYARECGRWML